MHDTHEETELAPQQNGEATPETAVADAIVETVTTDEMSNAEVAEAAEETERRKQKRKRPARLRRRKRASARSGTSFTRTRATRTKSKRISSAASTR